MHSESVRRQIIEQLQLIQDEAVLVSIQTIVERLVERTAPAIQAQQDKAPQLPAPEKAVEDWQKKQ